MVATCFCFHMRRGLLHPDTTGGRSRTEWPLSPRCRFVSLARLEPPGDGLPIPRARALLSTALRFAPTPERRCCGPWWLQEAGASCRSGLGSDTGVMPSSGVLSLLDRPRQDSPGRESAHSKEVASRETGSSSRTCGIRARSRTRIPLVATRPKPSPRPQWPAAIMGIVCTSVVLTAEDEVDEDDFARRGWMVGVGGKLREPSCSREDAGDGFPEDDLEPTGPR